MTWTTDQTFQAYHRPELVEVSSRAWLSETILKFPAVDVRAGNDYAFILTGILGGFAPLPFGDGTCEVTLQASTGTVYQSQHRQDMSVTEYSSSTAWGHPFMTIVVVPSASAIDYSMVFRADSGAAKIDAPSMQVWDLTKLGASAGKTANDVTVQQLTTTPQRLLQGPALDPGINWLVYWSAEIEQKSWMETGTVVPPITALWSTRHNTNNLDTNFPRTYFSNNGPQSSHIGCGPRAASKDRLDRRYTRIRMGDWFAYRDESSTYNPSVWGASDFGVGTGFTRDAIRRVDMVAINLDAGTKAHETQRVPSSSVLFPGSKDDLVGYRDEPRTQVRAFDLADPYPKEAATIATVRAGSAARGIQRNFGTTANFLLDIDNRATSPRGWVATDDNLALEKTLYVLVREATECLPTHRVLTPQLDKGAHCMRWYGRHDRLTTSDVPFWPNFYDATWTFLVPRPDFDPPNPVKDTAGPEVLLKIRREALADVSALPELPAGYAGQITFEAIDPSIDFRSEIEYLTRLPRFATPRRPVQLRYQALDLTGLQTVETFLRDLADTHGCFRAQLPDTIAETAYVLDVAEGWQASREGETYQISFRAIELLYTGAP